MMTVMRIASLFVIWLFLGQAFASEIAIAAKTVPPISGRNPDNLQQLLPADVLARVTLLNEELEIISQAMGKRPEKHVRLTVTSAQPREVYFEAQALFSKANRLSYEVSQKFSEPPPKPNRKIYPGDVWVLVNEAFKKIFIVERTLKIDTNIKEIEKPNSTTPSEAFNAIIKANQTLNSLLYGQFTPSDVYSQVTLSTDYAQELLKRFSENLGSSKLPPYEKNKTPEDVYKRLINCIELLKAITAISHIKMLNIHVQEDSMQYVRPSDVYDLSKILVAELSYLNSLSPGKNANIQAYYPGYKIPSDVFQKAGFLLNDLKKIKSIATQNSNWIKKITKY